MKRIKENFINTQIFQVHQVLNLFLHSKFRKKYELYLFIVRNL